MKNTVVFFITSISFLLFQQLAFGFESAENKSKTHFQLDRRMEISDQHANLTVLSMEKNMIEKKIQFYMEQLKGFIEDCGDKPNNECKEIINSMNNSIKHLEDERESKQNKMLFFENQLSIFQPY